MKYPRPSRLASINNLKSIWLDSKDHQLRKRAAGIDDIRPKQFAAKLNENLADARTRLLAPNFSFHGLRVNFIQKKDGGTRVICVPTVADRLIQRAVLTYLLKGDKLSVRNNVSYGFHKGSGVEKAVTTARKIRKDHRWVLKSDIHSFFNQIQRDTLKRDIAKTLKNRSVVPLLFSAIDAEAKHEGPHDKARLEALGIQTGLGLRQGMPLSPLLSNVVLRDFDLGIVQEKFKMVRYADDFVILCDNENECKEALDLVTKLLAAKEHTVPPLGPHSKTVVYSPDQSVEFLGFDISPAKNAYTLVAPQGVFERVNELCNPFENYADCKAEWKTLARALQSLNTKLFSFTNSYRIAANFDALRTHANNRKRQTVTDLLASILEVRAIPTLSPEKLLFLDVDPGE